MKKILVIILVVFLLPIYCLAQEEESFALIDWGNNKVVILDFSGNVLFEQDFNGIGICYFISPSANGWLVKGCRTAGCWGEDWIIWQLQPDGTINNTLTGLGPGPFYTGIGSGNFVAGNVYTGVIDLYNENGAIINSINVWAEEDGLPYNYSRLGDTAGLVSGGFVVPPQGGWPSINQLYTPYLYYYDNNLNLINTLDITTIDMRLLNLTGLIDGGFAGTCAAHGTGYDVESLCWFNSEGGLVEVVDVTNDLPFRQYMNVFIAGLSDGRVMLTVYGRDKVWIYDPPSSEEFFLASQTEVLDLSGVGVSAIGGIAGNILMLDTECEGDLDCDGVPDYEDNCPNEPNGLSLGICTAGKIGYSCSEHYDCNVHGMCRGICATDYPPMDGMPCLGPYECNVAGICDNNQTDTYPPQGNGIGDACDCESDFTCDGDVDADDVSAFLADFGREQSYLPCTNEAPCNGDFNCDGNVDADDVTMLLEDFGREEYYNSCPACTTGAWCAYPQ